MRIWRRIPIFLRHQNSPTLCITNMSRPISGSMPTSSICWKKFASTQTWKVFVRFDNYFIYTMPYINLLMSKFYIYKYEERLPFLLLILSHDRFYSNGNLVLKIELIFNRLKPEKGFGKGKEGRKGTNQNSLRIENIFS